MGRFFRILLFMPLLSLCCSFKAEGQVHTKMVPTAYRPGTISILIYDAVSKEPLPSASINIASQSDTLKLISSEVGSVLTRNSFKKDTLYFTSSCIGYQARTDTIICPKAYDNVIKIGLQEDIQQINEIIVSADAIAMVIHGDTTVFNATSFTTKQGTSLRELLFQLPGLSIDGNSVRYNGRQISRILFNGNNLFGKDISNAMNMVLAEEIKSVKVYDMDALDEFVDDPVRSKERVMDIHTWKPLQRVGELRASGGFGTESSKGAMLQLSNYVLGEKPRISGLVQSSNNSSVGNSGLHSSITPKSSTDVGIKIGKDSRGVGGWSHQISFNHDKTLKESGCYLSYMPSENWMFRNDTSRIFSGAKSDKLTYLGEGYARKKKTIFRFSGNITIASGNSSTKNIRNCNIDKISSIVSIR